MAHMVKTSMPLLLNLTKCIMLDSVVLDLRKRWTVLDFVRQMILKAKLESLYLKTPAASPKAHRMIDESMGELGSGK